MNYTFTKEDVDKIRRFKEIMNKGFYCSGQEVTELHNRVLGTRLASTNCGSCIRQRISALVAALARFEKQMEISGFTDSNEYFKALDIEKEKLSDIKPSEGVLEPNLDSTKVDDNNEPVAPSVQLKAKAMGRPKKKK